MEPVANPVQPHRASILMTVQVHSVLKSGESSGYLVPPEELAKFGLKPKVVLTVNGFDRQDCLNKLKTLLDQFK